VSQVVGKALVYKGMHFLWGYILKFIIGIFSKFFLEFLLELIYWKLLFFINTITKKEMEQKLSKKFLQDLIIVNSPRIGFHPITPVSFQPIKPEIRENFDYLSFDGILNRGFLVCKHCHYLQSNQCCNRKYLFRHLEIHHNIKDSTVTKPRLPMPKHHTLKAKKVPLIPIPKVRPNLSITSPHCSTANIPSTASKEKYKQGVGNQEVFQFNLKNLVPHYRTEEMVIELEKDEDASAKKMEKNKCERKRKREKVLPIDIEEEEIPYE